MCFIRPPLSPIWCVFHPSCSKPHLVCVFQEHKGHEVSSFTEGLHKYSNTLDHLVGLCREKINTVRDQLELINRSGSTRLILNLKMKDKNYTPFGGFNGALGTCYPPLGPICFIFMQFLATILSNGGFSAQTQKLVPHGKSWIRQ